MTAPESMSLRLHHVGILVDDISDALGMYMKNPLYKEQSDIVHDPVQTAYVKFLSCDQDAVLIELVAPDNPESKLSNALEKGGGLNHLCYETPSIEEACASLRQYGMFLVQPPVQCAAFPGRRIAWLMGRDGIPMELIEAPGAH